MTKPSKDSANNFVLTTATEAGGYTTVQFERDPETSDTDNDVQFKVSSSFFKITSPGGTVDPTPIRPTRRWKGGRSSGTKASHPCGEEGGATTCCQVFVSTKRGKNRTKKSFYTKFVKIVYSRFPCGSTDARN